VSIKVKKIYDGGQLTMQKFVVSVLLNVMQIQRDCKQFILLLCFYVDAD
jgi:hypothetical protein